jgi:hypothetical protein
MRRGRTATARSKVCKASASVVIRRVELVARDRSGPAQDGVHEMWSHRRRRAADLAGARPSGPDIEFREQFVWLAPSVKVGVDFAADEAVGRYRIDNITPCSCGG